jgi:hypothetical protein
MRVYDLSLGKALWQESWNLADTNLWHLACKPCYEASGMSVQNRILKDSNFIATHRTYGQCFESLFCREVPNQIASRTNDPSFSGISSCISSTTSLD